MRARSLRLGFACPAAALFGVLLAASGAYAAQVTEVADAVDGDDPFDANLELKLDLLRQSALITRENFQPPPGDPTGAARVVDVKEMAFERLRFRLRPRLEVGLFHDLAFFAEWPIVLWDQQSFHYADGTDAGNSTLARDQAPNASPSVAGWPQTEGAGNANPAIQDGRYGFPRKAYNDWRFNHSDNGRFDGYRQGFDNPTFGLRFSPLNNTRDDTKPTITAQADYTAPFFQFMDPTADALSDPAAPGPVSDGAHKFHFSMAMSKRYLILDPYLVVDYTIPFAATSGGALLGYQPRMNGGFTGGMEIVPYEDAALDQRFALDVSAFVTYFAPTNGRDYTEISDAIREQTRAEQWLRVGAQGGIFFKAFSLFFFDATASVAYNTEHILTMEDYGSDGPDANAQVDLPDVTERNPYFNPALDALGRRLKIEQAVDLGVVVHAGLTF